MTSHYWTAIDAADRMRSFWASPFFFFRHKPLFIFSFPFLFSLFHSFIFFVFASAMTSEWKNECVSSIMFCFFQHFHAEENVWSPSTFCVLGLCWHLYRTWNLTRNDTIATVLSLFLFHCFHCGWQLRCFFCSTFVYHKDCFALTTMRLLMCSVSFSFIPPSNVFFLLSFSALFFLVTFLFLLPSFVSFVLSRRYIPLMISMASKASDEKHCGPFWYIL